MFVSIYVYVCVKQEVDRIIAQMMHAADYLGWDVSELQPVSLCVCACLVAVNLQR